MCELIKLISDNGGLITIISMDLNEELTNDSLKKNNNKNSQADNLRHQTLHRLQQILTTRQAARCLLAIAEYFHRLRTLSSLWLARPRQE